MTKVFQCNDCDFQVKMENATEINKRIYLLGKCMRCGCTVAVDVEKLFIAFYQPTEKGN